MAFRWIIRYEQGPSQLFNGGGHGDLYWQKGRHDMEALINRTVKDPGKANQINGLVSEIINELGVGREQERAYHRQLYTLNVSYTAAPEEFTKLLEEANQQR